MARRLTDFLGGEHDGTKCDMVEGRVQKEKSLNSTDFIIQIQ